MSKSLTRRARAAFYLAWIPMSALLAVVMRGPGLTWIESVIVSLTLCIPFALVAGSAYYMCKALPLRRTHLFRVIPSLVGASVTASAAWVGWSRVVALAGPPPWEVRVSEQSAELFGIGVGFFLLSLAFHYLVLTLGEIRNAERRVHTERLLKREAELRALRAQINPHFLFNSLNSISALTSISPPRAREMCGMLSEFFRASLRSGDVARIPLREELDLARKYLGIEEVRFADRMKFIEDIPTDCHRMLVPPLILQPILENAVKHGIARLTGPGSIRLTGRRDGERCLLFVSNTVDADSPVAAGTGRGLRITRERLAAFYGDRARMVVSRQDDEYQVHLILPTDAGDR